MSKKQKALYEDLFVLADQAMDAGKHHLAFQLFTLSAEGGYVYAFNSLGLCFDNGRGVKKNSAKALACYKKAAAKGDYVAPGMWLFATGTRASLNRQVAGSRSA